MCNLQLFQPGGWQRRWNSMAYHLPCFPFLSLYLTWGQRVKENPHDSWMGNEGSSSSIFLGVRLAWLGIGALGERTGVDISSLKTTWKTKRKLKEEHRNKTSKRLALSQSLEFIILRRARGRLGERTWDWKNAMRDRQANTGELDTCLCAHMWPVE